MKKKIFVVALAACLLILSVAGSSIAYFTDTAEYTNVFTAGNVNITLTAKGDDINNTNNILDIKDEGVYPSQIIEKNVTINNVGTENAYVAAIITLTDDNGDLATVINKDGTNNNIPVAIATFLGGLAPTGYKVNVADIVENNNVVGYTIYLIKEEALTAQTGTAVLFEDIVIPADWDNDQMDAFEDLKIDVKAYATQTKGTGFDNAVSAIKTAFPAEFGSITFN